MNRKLISCLLLGAFVMASTSTFTSCKDYDDDISDLRNEITSTATTLEELVDEKSANAEREIAALNTQVSALDAAYKQADADLQEAIKQATNDAKGYADLQAAEAQRAAVAAAQELVDKAAKDLQDGLDAANATISDQGKTIQSLLAADVELQKGIDAAQAKADAAYNLAAQTNATAESNKTQLEKVAKDLETINETLSGQINVLGTQISAVEAQANQNAADILKQETALADLKKANEDALDKLNAADDVLNGLITKNQQDIAALQTKVDEAKKAADKALTDAKAYTDAEIKKVMELLEGSDTVDGINAKINLLEEAYKKADEALAKDIEALAKRVEANETAITKINAAITGINTTLARLMSDNVNNLITGIVFQEQDGYNVYAKVRNSSSVAVVTKEDGTHIIFPYKDAKGYVDNLIVGSYNVQEWAGDIYATINPTDINASKADIYLENSLMQAPENYTLGKPEVATGHLIKTRALKSANGLWRIPVKSTKTMVSEDDANEGLYPLCDKDEAAYALYTTYEQDTLDADGVIKKVTKKVYSHYAVGLNPTSVDGMGAGSYDLTVDGCGKAFIGKNSGKIKFSELNGDVIFGTSDKRVYKKYVECINVYNNNTIVDGGADDINKANEGVLQTVLAANNKGEGDTLNIVCPNKYLNKEIQLVYYIWNYDGSISVIQATLVFNKVMWGEDVTTITANPTPDSYSYQNRIFEAFSPEFPNFAFVKGESGASGSLWSHEVTSVEASVVESKNSKTAAIDRQITGATIKLMHADKTTSIGSSILVSSTMNTYSATNLKSVKDDLINLKELCVAVDPSVLTPEHEYVINLTFYNDEHAVVNNVKIYYTLNVPTFGPKPWHISAAFDSSYTQTIAWVTDSPVSGYAQYDFSGSFYDVDEGYTWTVKKDDRDHTWTIPYVFALEDAEKYDKKADSYFKVSATGLPDNGNSYVMQVPVLALNGVVVDNDGEIAKKNVPGEEYNYDMIAGFNFFGVKSSYGYNTKKGWVDHFKIKFLSPIRYCMLGTKDYIPGKTFAGMSIKVKDLPYGVSGSVTIDNSCLSNNFDPSKAADTKVPFFESADSRIATVGITFANSKDSNNKLIEIAPETNGKWTLKATDRVSMTGDATVTLNLIVTDKWGAVTTKPFTVTVKANK